jgi:uncharacterized protein VirK/YbjX
LVPLQLLVNWMFTASNRSELRSSTGAHGRYSNQFALAANYFWGCLIKNVARAGMKCKRLVAWPLHQRGALLARAMSAKNSLRWYLIKTFPITYDILFTSGNFDETLPAVIAGHREFVRLMRQPRLRDLLTYDPHMIYRPYRRYLATSFTKRDRRSILQHHYGYLLTRISETFFLELTRNRLLLWQKTIGQDVFTIKLSFTGPLHHEGDFLLEFEENSLRLYHLSFTIAPGYLAGSEAAQVILVGHVLGIVGNFDAMRRATKRCLDIAPPYLLMAAVQGMSAALNVGAIAGVKNTEQITSSGFGSEYFDYDAFWRSHLGTEGGRFFLISVPISTKPLALISASHRRRTLLKRRFKSEVAETSEAAFRGFLRPIA